MPIPDTKVHRDFFGISVYDGSVSELRDDLTARIERGVKTKILYLNPHHFLLAQKDHEILSSFQNADFVVCDGVQFYFHL